VSEPGVLSSLRTGSKFRYVPSTPAEIQSVSENDFECLRARARNATRNDFSVMVFRVFVSDPEPS
jgi:hypothetical protein